MFDQCDDPTMTVLDTARTQAQQLGHDYIGTEHVLLALTIHRGQLPESVAQLLPTQDQVRDALAAVIDTGPALPDADLLGTLGIDLDQVRAAVRKIFGPQALDRLAERRVHQPWQPWRRPTRACISLLAGQHGIAPRLKQAFEHARSHTTRGHQPRITPAHLLLGMVEVEDAMSNRLLRDLGVEPHDLRSELERRSA